MGNLLTSLLICGLMGLIGQGTRAVISLGNSKVLGDGSANQQAKFNSAYLTISLIVGFIAGVLAGLAMGIPFTPDNAAPDRQTLLGLIAAGYAGTDFIENTFARLMPLVGKTTAPGTQQMPGEPQFADATARSLTDTLSRLSAQVSSMGSYSPVLPLARSPAVQVNLGDALRTVLPLLDISTWLPALSGAFGQYGLNTPLRVAAAIGQFVAEVDSGFTELREDMSYSAAQLIKIFPNEFPDLAIAERYAGNAEAIGNYVYANAHGNGDVMSGDGYRFRGGGLIQLTGRDEYRQFAAAVNMDIDAVLAYITTAEGAAISGCWYLKVRGCLPLADQWRLTEITNLVNGGGMEGLATRIDYANRVRQALDAQIPGV